MDSGGFNGQWRNTPADRMTDRIHAEVKSMVNNSRLVRRSDHLALVKRCDLEVGELLGRGAFSEVHEVRVKTRGDNTVYAIKHLKAKLLSQSENFRLAAAELAVEAHMLASFDHPNVMKIRGWAANGVASFSDGRHDSFFLILDRLDETLDQRIETWRQNKPAACFTPNSHTTGNIVTDIWRRFSASPAEHTLMSPIVMEKIGVCIEIASALAYLHSLGVVFRDLKPNNIGFLNGRVQLFDFGLSRELPQLNLDEPFEMSGKVGTLRYMSPEVASHQVYNVSADVYSWAMVCFEIFVLDKPYQGWTRDMHANLVCGQGARPDASLLPAVVSPILESCWSQYPYRRPSMRIVEEQMKHIEEQHLLIACQHREKFSPEVAVELPHDFSVGRGVKNQPSGTFTNATANISIESLSDYLYQH